MKLDALEHGVLLIEFTIKKRKHIMPHWVNARQSKHERRFKRQIARALGLEACEADRIRNFTDSHFLLYLRSRGKIANK